MSPRRKAAARRAREQAPAESEAIRAPRPRWSGTITFGLVSIPVNLHASVRDARVRTRMLAADGTPLARRFVCPKDDGEVDWDHLVRGYETNDGEYVVVTDEELEALAPRKSRDIELELFIPVDSIDPLLLEGSYVLTPNGSTDKPYRLLADVMERERKAGIATFVMHDTEHLVAIRAGGGLLHAELLRFADEVRTPAQVGLPGLAKAPREMVTELERGIAELKKSDIAASELGDERTRRVRELVEEKRNDESKLVHAPQAAASDVDEDEVEAVDLMEAIRRSLREPKRSGARGGSRSGNSRSAAQRGKARTARTGRGGRRRKA